MKLKKSYITAGAICLLVVAWIVSGQVPGLTAPGGDAAGTSADGSERMTVRVATSTARTFADALVLRGRAQAWRKVDVKSEITGKIAALPIDKGTRVKAGEVLCRLSVDDRQARLDEAEALVRQRQLEYDAAVKLSADGFRSETQVAGAAAALDAAKAQVERVRIEIANTTIRAPFDGVVDSRPVELGDYLSTGGVCATLIDEDPYLVVAEVSERDVGAVSVGDTADIRFSSDLRKDGTIRYVAHAASDITRTFRIEIEVDNDDRRLREGLGADIRIPVKSAEAHLVSSGLLVLNDDGAIGLRLVDANSRVRFAPVTILGEDGEGLWVSGLPKTARMIVVGQSFVREGDRVETVTAGMSEP